MGNFRMSYLNEKMLRVKSERNLVFRAWLEWRQAFKLTGMQREDQINVRRFWEKRMFIAKI